eukprot:SAG22_NODE_15815_length_339_cov_2.670833_1_plen_24_part_10
MFLCVHMNPPGFVNGSRITLIALR